MRAGLAVTTLPASMVGDGLRILGPDEGLPELPLTRMGLIHAPGRADRRGEGARRGDPHDRRRSGASGGVNA